MSKSFPLSLTVEIGGQELLLHGTANPGDPGQISGPPERCWPPEPSYFETERVELVLTITEDLAPPPRKTRQIHFDITDMIEDLGGGDVVDEAAQRAYEDWETEND